MNMGLIILGVGVVAVLAMTMGKPKLTKNERAYPFPDEPGGAVGRFLIVQ